MLCALETGREYELHQAVKRRSSVGRSRPIAGRDFIKGIVAFEPPQDRTLSRTRRFRQTTGLAGGQRATQRKTDQGLKVPRRLSNLDNRLQKGVHAALGTSYPPMTILITTCNYYYFSVHPINYLS